MQTLTDSTLGIFRCGLRPVRRLPGRGLLLRPLRPPRRRDRRRGERREHQRVWQRVRPPRRRGGSRGRRRVLRVLRSLEGEW